MQAVIHGLLEADDSELWLNSHRSSLQFDENALHAYGFRFNQWAEGRIRVVFRDEAFYFTSDLIFNLLSFWRARALPSSAGIGNH
jgi:hypothetical protein